jgi:hypothetical protein
MVISFPDLRLFVLLVKLALSSIGGWARQQHSIDFIVALELHFFDE